MSNKIKLGQLTNSIEVVQKIATFQLPVKIAFKLAAITRELDVHLKSFEELRVNLIKRLGEEGEDGNIKVKDENIEQFVTEINELLGEEIELGFDKLSLESLPDSVELSLADATKVEWLFA